VLKTNYIFIVIALKIVFSCEMGLV